MPDQHVIEAIYESACSRRVVKADQRCRDFAVPRGAPPHCEVWTRFAINVRAALSALAERVRSRWAHDR
jgi:hypothetical protein